jgi:cytochrome c peroxidase
MELSNARRLARSPRRGRALLATAVLAAAAAFGLAAAARLQAAPLPASLWLQHPLDALALARGLNPHPVHLKRPPVAPLSVVARLGERLFNDARLSGSGRQSCASCHDPAHAHAPANDLSVQLGGRHLDVAGMRAVPSLRYLYRQANFSIGPDNEENENVDLLQQAQVAGQTPRSVKTAGSTTAPALVPQGGLFWDGRVDTLQQQASGPLFNPLEMDGGDAARVASVIEDGGYADVFRQLFGAAIFTDPSQVVGEAMFAIARYQVESPQFHPFDSKYDAWLEGRAQLSPPELRGYLAFRDPRRGNCAACHVDQPTRDGLPPLFSDAQYEALGVPRNTRVPANADAAFHDLGLCGPARSDLRTQTAYCGMFLTPTLRNAATRHAFFHNGVYHSLQQVLDFYNLRDVQPGRIYPKDASGAVQRFNDLPARWQANVDTRDPPFGRHAGEMPPMSAQDERDIIAFLGTLTDGDAAPDARKVMARNSGSLAASKR